MKVRSSDLNITKIKSGFVAKIDDETATANTATDAAVKVDKSARSGGRPAGEGALQNVKIY